MEKGKNEEEKNYVAEIGVWRTPSQFVGQALQAQHPFDDSSSLEDVNKMNIFLLLTEGPEARSRKCKVSLEHYKQRAAALQEEEDLIHRQLDEDRQQIVKGERFLSSLKKCAETLDFLGRVYTIYSWLELTSQAKILTHNCLQNNSRSQP